MKIQKEIGLDTDAVAACINQSGGTEYLNATHNSILDAQVERREDFGVVVLPTLVVNGVTASGGSKASNALQTMCYAFPSGLEPAVCNCAGLQYQSLHACVTSVLNGGSGIPSFDYHGLIKKEL